MKLVQRAVDDRREDDADDGDQREAAVKRVTAGKNFSGVGLQGSDRPHAGQDHRRVQKGIQPRHLFKAVITRHADAERQYDEQKSEAEVSGDAPVKNPARQQRF